MTGFSHRLAVVVPTKDRSADLRRMLDSLQSQSAVPDQVIVVDGGDETVEWVASEFPTLNIAYVRVFPPSLSKQRNVGMAELRPDITLAGYLDDDLVMEPRSVEHMLRYWETAPAVVGGARFNIINDPLPRAVVLGTGKEASIASSARSTSRRASPVSLPPRGLGVSRAAPMECSTSNSLRLASKELSECITFDDRPC